MSAPPSRHPTGFRLALSVDLGAILGDLKEEFRARVAHGPGSGLSRGLRARAWYWRAAMAIAARYALEPEPHLSGIRRPQRLEHLMDTVTHNLRYALPRLARTPLFTLGAILWLGLGFGADSGASVWMLTRDGMRLVLIGGGAGLILTALRSD